jgi:NAD/NADP transhydrogenase beta subunit
MEFGFTIAAYAVAAVLFILSLGGLSGQESAKRAVWYGIVGMAIAILATLIGPGSADPFGRRALRTGMGAALVLSLLLGAVRRSLVERR